MDNIPNIEDIEYYLDTKSFSDKFIQQLNNSIKNNRTAITMDFSQFKNKESIIKNLIEKGYKVSYCNFKEMYAIIWNDITHVVKTTLTPPVINDNSTGNVA